MSQFGEDVWRQKNKDIAPKCPAASGNLLHFAGPACIARAVGSPWIHWFRIQQQLVWTSMDVPQAKSKVSRSLSKTSRVDSYRYD